ncbi:carboxylesterase family protein [Novosphingobium flavum]|uniref:Carboxylic ester hydrolase n=1 Tax=Novosphingobium flavum TaxID=1778672 RepID=A0A7X1FRZ6_9SPHN|nr:carboxylesterase family protein [Novosphingobium flavum]MBC2665886.1 carboxylesterase family protein [Novosphingobium flavum]
MPRTRAVILAFALMPAFALPVGAADKSMQPISGDPVATASGRIAGTRLDSGIKAYLGVPYAEPPVGPLRWAPPRPAKWSGLFNADRKGPECIQVLRPHDINHYFGEEASGEDCLTLNLWAPAAAKAGEKRPVIVFLYGGGFTIGSSGMANYGGEDVAKAGAIYVNFNYRVGAFGFLAHPELTREQGGASGNYGLMDQTLALQWVHDNVAAFGGDPGKVLIIGQSAGASSVAAQVQSPAARGLFRAAVMSSGCNFAAPKPGLAEAERTGLALQQRLGAASLAAMRNVPADRILAAQSESQLGLAVSGVRIAGPIVDGRVLPLQSADAIASGQFAHVPMIASFNDDDLAFGYGALTGAADLAQYRAAAEKLFGADAAAFLRLYPARTDADVRPMARAAAQDGGFAASARGCAAALAGQGAALWIDRFARRHPYVAGLTLADQDPATVGAYHTADMPYWLGTFDAYNMLRPTRAWTAWDRALSARMMGALIAMAETGSPATAAMPWQAWSPRNDTMLALGDTIATKPFNLAGQAWLAAHSGAAAAQPRPAGPRD